MPTEFSEIVEWYDHLWQQDSATDFSELILTRLRNEQNKETVDALNHVLRFEYIRLGKYDEALKVAQSAVATEPDNSLKRISLAEFLFYYRDDAIAALEECDRAIAVSEVSHQYRRYALHVKARILQRLMRFSELENCLIDIMALELGKDEPDVGREGDFVQELPEGAVSQFLLDKYLKYMNA